MPAVETLIKLVNVKINSNDALNTNKLKRGDTIR